MLHTLWRKAAAFLRAFRIRIGVNPDLVCAPALVLFPVTPTVLFCGLAGILTVKLSSPPPSFDAARTLSEQFEALRSRRLSALLAGEASAGDYLGGADLLGRMEAVLGKLKEEDHFRRLFFDTAQSEKLSRLVRVMGAFFSEEEKVLEGGGAGRFNTQDLETVNARLVLLRDILWTLGRDILENIERIVRLANAGDRRELSPEAFAKYEKLNLLLNNIDRLEVRGRDSAGIEISFATAAADCQRAFAEIGRRGLADDFAKRTAYGDLMNGSIRVSRSGKGGPQGDGAGISFVYKTASIIGELGRNVHELRAQIARDGIFRIFADLPADCEAALAHTRWASVGSITEENCHPINNAAVAESDGDWSIDVVLNGDVDNYQSLRTALESDGELVAPELTTDTKIIPLQIEKYLREGHPLDEAFRLAVNDFEGSHAIAMASSLTPGRIYLALRGSGQALYVGIAPDRYLFASELYGIVEGTSSFIKMDGERTSPGAGGGSGQIVVLDCESAGGLAGIRAFFYDGTPLALDEGAVSKAEITTRDIHRGDYPHFFLKEVTESALSVRKTLRGKYRISRSAGGGRRVAFNLGEEVLPLRLRESLREGRIRRILVIGHGTAAVAGAAVADAFARHLKGSGIEVESKIASELSGFSPDDDLADALVIPVTQSGTTTDTNRAVAMAAEKGATIVSIVNRRQSDITVKSHGVFYTSDGRDIEMSVASTKAFYSQIVAGHILALNLAQLAGTLDDEAVAAELANLEEAPARMAEVVQGREAIRKCAEALYQKRYWAVVGSGPDKIAADEIRIKLSELCYRTISSDVVENKKHIDLSAEPLILVCAAGSPETVLGDIAKDVAIFKAHKASVVVFADAGDDRFDRISDAVLPLPRSAPPLPVILNTLAGHLWGYYAACRIDAEAAFLKEFRSRLNQTMVEQAKRRTSMYEGLFDRDFRRMVRDFAREFNERRRQGAFSVTGVRTASDIVLLLKYAVGKLPIEDFWEDFRTEDDPVSPVEMLDLALGRAMDELSRPIDAIRHQAKTVTVGTSRKKEEPAGGILFDLLKELGFSAKRLVGKNIMALSRLQPAIALVRGYTLYDVNGLNGEGNPTDASTIAIRQRGGIAASMKSRTESSGLLMGTKRSIVSTGHLYAGRGKMDGASIVIIPLLGERGAVRSLLLLHVSYNEKLTVQEKKEVLGYRHNDIRNLVNEYNLPWDDRYLEDFSVEDLLSDAVETLAGRIRRRISPEASPLETGVET
ncbi:MAG TPA: SIS domain-containing protein [Syntrophales bacterium]|nr:SIS domain-containing protein [Syntrophales bacterium]